MSLVGQIMRGAGLKPQASANVVVEQLFGGMFEENSESGEVVSVERGVALPSVFRAIRLLSEVPGALPLITYKVGGAGHDRDESHPTFELLHEQPNPEIPAVEFWTLVLAQFAGWGRAFIGKEFAPDGTVRALHPIEPKKMRVERRDDGSLLFHEQLVTGSERLWTRQSLIYLRLFTLDGVTGLSPIGLQRETVGLGLAMRKHGARFFRDAAIPPGALTVQQEIRDPAVRDRIRAEWANRHGKSREIAVLDAGAKFETISIPLEDAQFVQLWGATKADVADAFNLPHSLLGAPTGDSFTYGNREADTQQFLTFTLHNPLRKFEQALTTDRDLFPRPQGKRTHFCEFLREDLLRPDSQARANFYRFALDPKFGWMRRDEVRKRENLPTDGADDPFGRAVASAMNGHHEEVTT